ncbi:hypothetical protein SELMODRAFT_71945, partial [Selaginella moellendorffii]
TLLAAYAKEGQIAKCGKIFEAMDEKDIVSWSSILAAYAQSRCLLHGETLRVLNTMNLTHSPDESCFVSVLLACSHAGKLEAARRSFVSMRMDFGLNPTKQHYCCVLDLCGRLGRLDEAWELIAAMPFVPDALDWKCLLASSYRSLEHRSERDHAKLLVETSSPFFVLL